MSKHNLDFASIEEKWKKYWEKEEIYKADFSSKKKPLVIDNPPPTVSGNMHIGHAFQYSQQDFIARFKRMKGEKVIYPFGTDDNGLPTERLIERLKKVKSLEMSRADFIKLCLKTLKEITPDFVQDWKDIAISSDYDLSYSTIDDNSRKISQKYFIELAKKGEAYKQDFPTIWCPECQTSIAQAELEDKELGSLFSTLKFDVNGEDLLIATTRPELLGACVAVFVNPKDKRYKKFVGKKAKVPLFDIEVPILEDESAEIDKGTGVLMICSYGDRFDVDAINRHKLQPRVILNKDGTLNIGNYKGLKVKDARKKILEDLKEAGLITKQDNISHVVNVHDKCGTEIEFLMTKQWFIKILDKKKKWLEQAKKVRWYPEFMKKRYDNWVNGLEWDWSISRNRHFGIPIPVWECEECGELIFPSEKELPVDPLQTKKKCPKCSGNGIPEEMVFDTWATSSLTPQIIFSLVKDKLELPTFLRVNAHDIIRTWDFYTIVRSFLHENKLPWENLMVTGFITLGGEKLSKSKGIIVDPRKVLAEHGADALRFWAASSKLGNDLDYQDKDLVTGKKLVTKLLNASRFVFMNLEDYDLKKPKTLEKLDELFLGELNSLIKSVTEYFESYESSRAKNEIEQFFWQKFTDNYLEIVKKRVYQGSGESKKSAQYTLYKSLLVLIKLFAPIISFITEEIYQEHFRKFEEDKSIHISSWPESGKEKTGEEFNLFLDTLSKVRQEKSFAGKAMNSEIILTLTKEIKSRLEPMLDDLKNVTNASEIKEGNFSVEFK